MKKISLILLGVFGLLFSTNVYADTGVKVTPFDYFYVTNNSFVDNTNVDGAVNFYKGQNWHIFPFYGDYNIGDFYLYNADSPFGHYSDGSNIQYYRTQQVYDIANWNRSFNYYTDSNNEFFTELSIDNSRRIDFTHIGWACNYDNGGTCYDSVIGKNSFRIDFAVQVRFHDSNYNSIKNELTDKIFNGIRVPELSLSSDTCFYDSFKSSYIINISCVGMVKKSFTWSLEFSNFNDYTVLTDSYNYSIRADFYISEATLITSPTGRYEDLILDNSPNGDSFNNYYKKVEIQGNSYFDKFDNFEFNGLSNVIIAPLQFVRSLSTPYLDDEYTRTNKYSIDVDPLKLSFSVFGHNISIPSGHIFWNRGLDIFNRNKARLLSNFRNTWNILLGGFIIYLLCVKLFKVCVNALDPHKEGIENL